MGGHYERSEAIQNGLPRSRWSLAMTNGFTLAEVLITLAIIGIVAALTIPTLVANYQKRALVVQLQKTYATIANAAKMVMADEQVDNLNNTYLRAPDQYDDEKEVFENSVGRFLKTYFKVVKTCNVWDDNINECVADNYISLDGENGDFNSYYCGILSNGAVICMWPFDYVSPMYISIDVNGKNGPNVFGRDAFNFDMNYRGELAESFDPAERYTEKHKPENCASSESLLIQYGAGCLSKIIQDGWKMDY